MRLFREFNFNENNFFLFWERSNTNKHMWMDVTRLLLLYCVYTFWKYVRPRVSQSVSFLRCRCWKGEQVQLAWPHHCHVACLLACLLAYLHTQYYLKDNAFIIIISLHWHWIAFRLTSSFFCARIKFKEKSMQNLLLIMISVEKTQIFLLLPTFHLIPLRCYVCVYVYN